MTATKKHTLLVVDDESDVGDYRDMVTIVRDRVRDMVQKKMTLAQVKAARLTRDRCAHLADRGEEGWVAYLHVARANCARNCSTASSNSA